MKLYSFIKEDCMCAAGVTAYESPATNSGTFEDVYCKKNKKKKHKKSLYNIPSPYKKDV